MNKIVITRKSIGAPVSKKGQTQKGTFGELRVFINDKAQTFTHPQTKKTQDFLYTMENEIEGSEANKDLRIPADSYFLKWTPTNATVPPKYRDFYKYTQDSKQVSRHKALLVCHKNNADFEKRRILIHVGNDAIDTLGCPLVGWGKNDSIITESTIACELLYDVIDKTGIDSFILEIKNEM